MLRNQGTLSGSVWCSGASKKESNMTTCLKASRIWRQYKRHSLTHYHTHTPIHRHPISHTYSLTLIYLTVIKLTTLQKLFVISIVTCNNTETATTTTTCRWNVPYCSPSLSVSPSLCLSKLIIVIILIIVCSSLGVVCSAAWLQHNCEL